LLFRLSQLLRSIISFLLLTTQITNWQLDPLYYQKLKREIEDQNIFTTLKICYNKKKIICKQLKMSQHILKMLSSMKTDKRSFGVNFKYLPKVIHLWTTIKKIVL